MTDDDRVPQVSHASRDGHGGSVPWWPRFAVVVLIGSMAPLWSQGAGAEVAPSNPAATPACDSVVKVRCQAAGQGASPGSKPDSRSGPTLATRPSLPVSADDLTSMTIYGQRRRKATIAEIFDSHLGRGEPARGTIESAGTLGRRCQTDLQTGVKICGDPRVGTGGESTLPHADFSNLMF